MSFKSSIFVLILIFVITACTIIDDSGAFSSSPNIFCILRTGDDFVRVLVDSSVSISSQSERSLLFIHDASVNLNGEYGRVDTLEDDSLGYNYIYTIDTKIEGEKDYKLSVCFSGDTFSALSAAPKEIDFLFMSDSSVLKLDTMSFLMWNRSGIDFYFVQFYEKSDSGYFNSFSIGVQNDTFTFLFPFSFALPDSALYDITVTAMDSSYLMGMMGNESSFGEDAYGLFGAVSVGTLHDIMIVK